MILSEIQTDKQIRFTPDDPKSKLPPECAGVYYVYDKNQIPNGSNQTLNLRKAIKKQMKVGNISEGGFVDCFLIKNGLTYDQLSYDDRNKVNKYNPPLNPPDKCDYTEDILALFPSLEKYMPKEKNKHKDDYVNLESNPKRHSLYQFLGYERIDVNKEVYYLKEPKALFFIVFELIVKCLLAINTISALLGTYLKVALGVIINQYVLLGMVALPIVLFSLFGYIRRNKIFKAIAFFSVVVCFVLYFISYPLLSNWPFA